MLGKLLKYEIKSTSRIFLLFYPLIIAMALLNKLLLFVIDSNDTLLVIPKILSITLYVLLIIAVFIITFIVTIQRFYKNLLGQEGYLMFTLPVETSSLIFSKLIVAFMWNIASMIVTAFSIFILMPLNEIIHEFPEAYAKLNEFMLLEGGISFTSFLVKVGVLCVISLIGSLLMIYASMAIGHLANKHRILCSIGAFFGLYAVVQTIGLIIAILTGNDITTNLIISAQTSPSLIMNKIFLYSLIVDIAVGVGYFIITNLILSKKLNLE